jgi:hypothetical protein
MYKDNIPQPDDILKTSQSDLLGNFQAIKTLIDVNHGTFGAADQGKHKFIQFPIQFANPVTSISEVALYSKNGAISAVPELFFRRSNNGDITEFTEGGNAANEGFSSTPSGFLLKWGFQDFPGDGALFRANTVVFNPAFPVFTNIFNIQMSTAILSTETDPRSVSYIIRDQITVLDFGIFTASYRNTGFSAFRVYYYAIGD